MGAMKTPIKKKRGKHSVSAMKIAAARYSRKKSAPSSQRSYSARTSAVVD